MEESSVYQAILKRGVVKGRAEGRAEEAREILLRIYTRRFGPPSADVVAKLNAVGEVEQLEQLAERGWEAGSWEELLNISSK